MLDHAALAIAPRFTRAVHIRRDFRDLRYRLDGYQVTPLVRQLAGLFRIIVAQPREILFGEGRHGAFPSAKWYALGYRCISKPRPSSSPSAPMASMARSCAR